MGLPSFKNLVSLLIYLYQTTFKILETMKNIFIIIMIFFSLTSSIISQNKRDYKWVMGLNRVDIRGGDIIDFDSKRSIDTSFIAFAMGSNSVNICDKEGNLLMYSNGCSIADHTHHIMEGGDSINYGESWERFCTAKYNSGYPVSQNSLILPDPGNEDGYYLLHKRTELLKEPFLHTWTPGVSYSYVDMKANNGKGKVTEKNKLIFETSSLTQGYMTACKHENERDWWLIQVEEDTNVFFKILLTKDTIMVVDSQSIGQFRFVEGTNQGQAVFTPDGSKWIAFNSIDKVIIYDFDRATGELSNLQRVNPQDSGLFVGIVVSPNSRFAYISAKYDLYQIDLWEDDIQSSLVHIAHIDYFRDPSWPSTFSLAQLAPDCKIYIVSGGTNNYLHVINNPNEKGKACDFQQHSFYLPNRNYNGSLPNFPHFRIDDEDICDSTLTWIPKIFWVGDKLDVKIYPNPVREKLTLQFATSITEELNYTIFSIQGVRVINGQLPMLKSEISIDVSFVKSGIYMLQITDENQEIKWSNKIIVE